jgi:drug/metabolite transporter (DMT)-like permease
MREMRPKALVIRHLMATVASLAVVALVAWSVDGSAALVPPVLAAVVCFFSAAVGVVASDRFGKRLDAYQRMLIGMLVRMAIPLAACAWLIATRPRGRGDVTAFVLYTVLFYLVAVGVEIWSSISRGSAK